MADSALNTNAEESEASHVKQHIQGLCLTMCPNEEIRLRQKENLVHILESKVNGKGQRTGYPDSRRMVKEFSRSAAGQEIKAVNIRPYPVLKRTVDYLLSVVCAFQDVSWREIYDFVNDRLRAVRQDLTVQAIRGEEGINILAPAARFYIYAHYRLCEYEDSEFEPYLNLKQLNEVLLTILSIHKENDYSLKSRTIDYDLKLKEKLKEEGEEEEEEPSSDEEESISNDSSIRLSTLLSDCHIHSGVNELRISSNDHDSTQDQSNNMLVHNHHYPIHNQSDESDNILVPYSNIKCVNYSSYNSEEDLVLTRSNRINEVDEEKSLRPKLAKYTVMEESEAFYLLINLGNVEAITHALELPASVRCSNLVSRVLKVSMCWMNGNHIPLIQLSSFLTPTLALALHIHLNKVQRHALGVLSVAHNSKVTRYPTDDLKKYLLFSSTESLNKACQYYGLSTTEEGVQFIKANFKWDLPVTSTNSAE